MANTAPSFSAGHSGRIDPQTKAWIEALALRADGKILAADSFGVYLLMADGSIDTSFGSNGYVNANLIAADAPFRNQRVWEIAQLPSGKFLVAGYGPTAAATTSGNTAFALTRLNADGSPDTSFGTGGIAHTMFAANSGSSIDSMFIMADGRIVVAGDSSPLGADGNARWDVHRIALARYLPDGKPDPSFGINGVVASAEGALSATAVTVQADGKLVVVAGGADFSGTYNVFRFNADGSSDASFGINGRVQTNFPSYWHSATANAVKVQPDGKIVVAGGSYTTAYNAPEALTAVRYNPDGSLDLSFGIAGRAIIVIRGDGELIAADAYARAASVDIGADGKITLAGSVNFMAQPLPGDALAVVRLNSDGSLDRTFDGDGIAKVATAAGSSTYYYGSIVRPDGSILLAGLTFSGGGARPVAASLNADGTFDATFGAPSDALVNQLTYVQHYPAQALDPLISLHDAELATARTNFADASITLARSTGANASDIFSAGGALSFKDGQAIVDGTAIGSVTQAAGSLRIVFNARATEALVNVALRSIHYEYIGTATGPVRVDWTFSDGNTGLQGTGGEMSAHFSTQVTVAAWEVPYWIDAQLDRGSPGQSAPQFRTEQRLLLAPNQSVALKFDPSATFSAAEQAQVQTAFSAIAAVTGLRLDAAATPVTFHRRADTSAFDTATSLRANGADVYFGNGSGAAISTSGILHDFGHVFGLKDSGGLGDLDIAALQYLYGPNSSVRSGNDVYTLNAATSNFIWDGGGTDTISAAGLTQDVTLFLTPGEWGYVGSRAGAITAAGQVTVNYGSQIENAVGGNGNDRISGTIAANKLAGGAGNDRLAGMGGGDALDGGSGIDFAVYAGPRTQYVVLPLIGGGYTVQPLAGGPVDVLENVERIEFSDTSLAIDGNAAQAYRLYQATFDRKPDAAGMGYWLDAMDHGLSLKSMTAIFMGSPEFIMLFGSAPDSTVFITALYANVLHRAPDTEGLAWWKGQLDHSTISFADALYQFSESAENQAQLVGQTQGGVAFVPYVN